MTHHVRRGADARFVVLEKGILDDTDDRMTPTVLAVYVALLMYCDQQSTCFPSYQTLGKRAHVSRDSAKRAIQTLIDMRLVSKIERYHERADDDERGLEQTSNLYLVFTPSELAPVDEVGADSTHPPVHRAPTVGAQSTTK